MPQSNLVVATVDDDRRVRESVQSVLESAGYEAVTFESAETFLLSGALSSVTCVIADVRLPGMDGTELQRRIRRERRQLPVILITAHDDDDVRQQALRDGAVAFLVKPFDGGDLLEHVARATSDVLTIRAGGTGMAGPLIGSSVAFREVTEAIAMVAPVDSAVLLLGETGTGKEVIARAIHDAGPRRHQRFVAVNCAAIPVGLLESELFGHERGAFTGAVSQTVGRFQAADRGTLFLDEVGDLPLELQPKLLRALQEQQVERLGSGGRPTSVDVRVIAATNQDLEEMVQQRAFRADLFYRLNVFPIRVPPLRERAEDIPLLIAHFVRQFAERQGKKVEEVPDEVIATLKHHSWPGNVRELQNVIERAVVATTGPTLRLPEPERRVDRAAASSRTLAQVERDHIVATLQATNWVLGGWDGAAARLGLSRTTLISRMQRLGISAGSGLRKSVSQPAILPLRSGPTIRG